MVVSFGQTLSVTHRWGIAFSLVIVGLLMLFSALRTAMAGSEPQAIAFWLGLVIVAEGFAGAFMLSALLRLPRSQPKSDD